MFVQHGEGVLVWGCFAAAEPGPFNITEATRNPTVDQKLLEEHVKACGVEVESLCQRPFWDLPVVDATFRNQQCHRAVSHLGAMAEHYLRRQTSHSSKTHISQCRSAALRQNIGHQCHEHHCLYQKVRFSFLKFLEIQLCHEYSLLAVHGLEHQVKTYHF